MNKTEIKSDGMPKVYGNAAKCVVLLHLHLYVCKYVSEDIFT